MRRNKNMSKEDIMHFIASLNKDVKKSSNMT